MIRNFKTFTVMLFLMILISLITTTTSFRINSRVRNARVQLKLTMAVTEVTSVSSFDGVVKSADKSLVVIDYSTTWCGPCKVAYPKFVELSDKYPKVLFLKCIGDTSPEAGALMKREGVRSVPCFHFWKNNERFEVINGARMDEIEMVIKDHLKSES